MLWHFPFRTTLSVCTNGLNLHSVCMFPILKVLEKRKAIYDRTKEVGEASTFLQIHTSLRQDRGAALRGILRTSSVFWEPGKPDEIIGL